MYTLIIDNYDSFTFNLYQYTAELKGCPIVYRNDELDMKKIAKIKPTHIIISPGPGTPNNKEDIGICEEIIESFGAKIPILGVCLGHQAIVHHFGGKIKKAPEIFHGKTSLIKHKVSPLFKDIPKEFEAMRYHSLIADTAKMPAKLKVTAQTKEGKLVMAVEHKKYPIYGIQFHPESIGTKYGKKIIENFLKIKK